MPKVIVMRRTFTFWRATAFLTALAFAGVWLIKLNSRTDYRGTYSWTGYSLLIVSIVGFTVLLVTEIARLAHCLSKSGNPNSSNVDGNGGLNRGVNRVDEEV